jgi:hypothetical protein
MKRLLLLVLLLGAVGKVQAQAALVNFIANGVVLGVRAASNSTGRTSAKPSPGQYRGLEYPRLRTPAKQLGWAGGDQIAYQEKLLQQCQDTMLSDTTAALGNDDVWAAIKSSQDNIGRNQPKWNVTAYREELAFYMAEDARRRRQNQPAATTP